MIISECVTSSSAANVRSKGPRHASHTVAGYPFRGFTLLEIMLAVAIILLLCSIAVPHYQRTLTFAHEARLRDDLFTMRSMIDRFTLDNKRPPESLGELIEKGYLGAVPIDPITGSDQTWQAELGDFAASPEDSVRGVMDVHSGSDQISLAGTPYSSW